MKKKNEKTNKNNLCPPVRRQQSRIRHDNNIILYYNVHNMFLSTCYVQHGIRRVHNHIIIDYYCAYRTQRIGLHACVHTIFAALFGGGGCCILYYI